MWTKQVPFSALLRDLRWKVEFFSGDAETRPDTAYQLVRLAEIVRESRETIDPQSESNRQFNYLSLENVASHTGDLVGFSPRFGREIKSRTKVFTEGNILYGRLRPNLNKVFVADEVLREGICSGEFYVLIPDRRKIVPVVLRSILASPFVREHIAKFQSGAALPRVPIGDLMNVLLPLPPMEDQLRIARFIVTRDRTRIALQRELENLPRSTEAALVQCIQKGNVAGLKVEEVLA